VALLKADIGFAENLDQSADSCPSAMSYLRTARKQSQKFFLPAECKTGSYKDYLHQPLEEDA
jgi:hypothetical protein